MPPVFHSLDIETASTGEVIDEIQRLIHVDPDTATDDETLDAIIDLIDDYLEQQARPADRRQADALARLLKAWGYEVTRIE